MPHLRDLVVFTDKQLGKRYAAGAIPMATLVEAYIDGKVDRERVVSSYGERWYRLWDLFLAWSWRIGAQGTSACFQVVAHKNLDSFDRSAFLGSAVTPAADRHLLVGRGVAAE